MFSNKTASTACLVSEATWLMAETLRVFGGEVPDWSACEGELGRFTWRSIILSSLAAGEQTRKTWTMFQHLAREAFTCWVWCGGGLKLASHLEPWNLLNLYRLFSSCYLPWFLYGSCVFSRCNNCITRQWCVHINAVLPSFFMHRISHACKGSDYSIRKNGCTFKILNFVMHY